GAARSPVKKFLLFAVLLISAITYINATYTVQDAIDYAVKKNDPKLSPKIEYNAGYYQKMKDRHEEAIKTFEALLETWPDNDYKGDAIFHLGEAYENTRNKPKAAELYEKYLEENPKGSQSDLARRKLELFKS